MTMVNKDSQSAIEQKEKSALHSLLLWVCAFFYFSIFEFSDWFFKNTI